MSTSAPDPRHRAVETIERTLADSGCDIAAGLAREIVLRLEAAGLVIHPAPAPIPRGRCEIHGAPHPCQGCAADAKAKPDPEAAT
jgi:hypothetical protein